MHRTIWRMDMLGNRCKSPSLYVADNIWRLKGDDSILTIRAHTRNCRNLEWYYKSLRNDSTFWFQNTRDKYVLVNKYTLNSTHALYFHALQYNKFTGIVGNISRTIWIKCAVFMCQRCFGKVLLEQWLRSFRHRIMPKTRISMVCKYHVMNMGKWQEIPSVSIRSTLATISCHRIHIGCTCTHEYIPSKHVRSLVDSNLKQFSVLIPRETGLNACYLQANFSFSLCERWLE